MWTSRRISRSVLARNSSPRKMTITKHCPLTIFLHDHESLFCFIPTPSIYIWNLITLFAFCLSSSFPNDQIFSFKMKLSPFSDAFLVEIFFNCLISSIQKLINKLLIPRATSVWHLDREQLLLEHYFSKQSTRSCLYPARLFILACDFYVLPKIAHSIWVRCIFTSILLLSEIKILNHHIKCINRI